MYHFFMNPKLLVTFISLIPVNLCAQTEYIGGISVTVGGSYGPYVNESVCHTITHETDGSLTLTIHQFTLTETVIGDLTLGQYTVSQLTYDDERGGYYRDYTNDGLTMHFSSVSGGVTTMDNDYGFDQRGGNVLVKLADDGTATIVNTFQPGVMPFLIVSTFVGQSSIEALPEQMVEPLVSDYYDLWGRPVSSSYRGLRLTRYNR